MGAQFCLRGDNASMPQRLDQLMQPAKACSKAETGALCSDQLSYTIVYFVCNMSQTSKLRIALQDPSAECDLAFSVLPLVHFLQGSSEPWVRRIWSVGAGDMAATTKKICELPADIADVVLANHPVVVDRSMGVLQQVALVPALAHKHVVSANCSPSRHEFEEHPLRPYCLWEAESVVHKFNASRLPASALLVHPLRDTLFAQKSIAHWRVACESILLAGYNVAPSTEIVAWLSEPDFVRHDQRPSIADTIANVRVTSQLTVYDCHSDLRHHICSSDKLAAIRSMTGLRSLMLHGCSHGITMVEAFGVVEVMPWLVFLRCAVNGAIVMKIHTSSPAPCIPQNAVALQKRQSCVSIPCMLCNRMLLSRSRCGLQRLLL